MKQAPWSRIREQNSVDKEFLEIVGSGKPTGSVLKETIAVSDTMSLKRAKMTQPNPSPSSFMQQNERKSSRTRSPRGRSPSGRMFRLPCKDYLKGTCTNSFCEKWHPPECSFYKSENGCRFGKWKSDELMEVRTGRLVLFAQHTDRFIIDDDDMDSNIVAESEVSLKSRSFLHRVNDQVQKKLIQSSNGAIQDSNKHS